MKIIVIGGSGLLGHKLVDYFKKEDYKVYATYYSNLIEKPNYFNLNITKKNECKKLLNKIKPDVIINCSAYTDVDGCEKNKKIAYSVNAIGTKNLAEYSEKISAKLIYISTDYVFDGKKGLYKEDDIVNPVNYYGTTKLDGESFVRDTCNDFIIARTSVIFGFKKNNFALWCINNLKNKKNINIVTDQFISPTLNTDLSEQLISLIKKNAKGLFHTTGGERISRYDFTTKLSEVFNYDNNLINPIKMNDINWVAKRPIDSSLDVSKVSKFKKPYKVHEALELLRRDMGGII